MSVNGKLVVVTGATGAQGGGVVDAVRASTNAKIRAITRNPSSTKAKDLSSRGVEVVAGDLDDKASLVKAFQGADALFLVTDFYGGAKGNPEFELQQGENAVDAAKEAGVKHVIFSSLEDFPQDVRDKLPALKEHKSMIVPHFESKAAIAEYLRKSGLSYTLLITCMFYENTINFTEYHKQPDGSYTYGDNVGTEPHGWHAVGDIGLAAAEIVKDPAKYDGETIPVVGERISQPEIAKILSDVTGKTIKYTPITDEQYAALPFPVAAELANMYSYYRQFPYYDENRPMEKRLADGPTFRQWAEAHREELLKKLEPS